MPSDIVIVGASAAGLSVAETLRRQGSDGRITMIGAEDHLPYDRPPLSKEILSGKWPDERVWLREAEAIAGLDIDLRLSTRADSADADARTVSLSDGTSLRYDELVIATGVRARRLRGTDGVPGVHVLRTLDDAKNLRAALTGGPRLVIVGAGFVGAEVASVARQLGADVTLVSDIPAPLSDVLGTALGELLMGLHAEHGVRIIAGTGVQEVIVKDGRAQGVRLADGREIGADAVLVSIGSIPNAEWLAGSGIETGGPGTGGGVLCDQFCRARPGVWAAGDVASWHHPVLGERLRIEHRTNAAEQGMAVARNILAAASGSDLTPFTPVPYIWSDQYDLKVQIYGLPRGADRFTVTEGTTADRKLVALYGKGGVVRAAVGINMVRPVRTARTLVAAAVPWDEAVPAGEAVPAVPASGAAPANEGSKEGIAS